MIGGCERKASTSSSFKQRSNEIPPPRRRPRPSPLVASRVPQAFGTGSDDSSCRLFDMRCYGEANYFGNDKVWCGVVRRDALRCAAPGDAVMGAVVLCASQAWPQAGEPAGRGPNGLNAAVAVFVCASERASMFSFALQAVVGRLLASLVARTSRQVTCFVAWSLCGSGVERLNTTKYVRSERAVKLLGFFWGGGSIGDRGEASPPRATEASCPTPH